MDGLKLKVILQISEIILFELHNHEFINSYISNFHCTLRRHITLNIEYSTF